MPRRTFRYNKELDRMVEIPLAEEIEGRLSIHGEIEPFISPVDGTLIKSRSHLRDYMGERGLVHFSELKGNSREEDRYEQQRKDRALRELLWEGVSRTFSMGNRPRR
jgi:hypothetical protein